MITERTLKRWRKDALAQNFHPTIYNDIPKETNIFINAREAEMCQRILRLTQELLDLQLMKKV